MIRKGRFENQKIPSGVALWNFQPRWPGTDKAKLSEANLSDQLRLAYDHSMDGTGLMLWMPARMLHRSSWDIWEDAAPWVPASTLVSGFGDSLRIGILYGKKKLLRAWEYRQIDDTVGSGSTSSLTVKWLLDELFPDGGGTVMDPYAHSKGVLASYCRRQGVEYVGYMQSKKGYEAIKKVLAQVEFPEVQIDLL